MAKSISEEELQLRKRARRRLIGAIALVTVVAVFLPMVLDHEPKPVSQDISIQIPAPDAGTFISKIVPVIPGAPDAKTSAKPAPETPAMAEPPKAVAAAKPAAITPPPNDTEASPPKMPAADTRKPQLPPKPVPKPTPKPAAAAKNAATTDAADGKSGFVVQVVALSDADKAKQMQEQILAAGIKSYTEVVPTAKGSVTRVRAGPFASRDDAEKARERLKELGLSGNLVPK